MNVTSTFLSIVPVHGGPLPLDVDKPIVSSTTTSSVRPPLKHVSFSLPFATLAAQRRTSALQQSEPASKHGTLAVRLASDDVLLPFVDRACEVKTLLDSSPSGRLLCEQLTAVLSPSRGRKIDDDDDDEWTMLRRILFTCDRDTLSDRAWLGQVYAIIFPRSPRLWCHFAECVGARSMSFDKHAYIDPSVLRSASSFSPVESPNSTLSAAAVSTDLNESAVYEGLRHIPAIFRQTPLAIRSISAHEDATSSANFRPTGAAAATTNLSECGDDAAEHTLTNAHHAFAGLRIGLASPSPSASVLSSPRSSILDDGSTADVRFTKHRRLSQLLVPLPFEQDAKTDQSASKPSRQLQRSRSLSEAQTDSLPSTSFGLSFTSTASRGGGGLSPAWSPSLSGGNFARRRARGLTVPGDDGERAYASQQQSHPPSTPNTTGLLPDGRTRHPSAGESDVDDLGATLNAFRQRVQLESLMPGKNDNGGTVVEPDPLQSPLSDASDEISVHTPRDFVSPLPASTAKLQSKVALTPSSLVFPVPPNVHFSRPQELLKRLYDARSSTDAVIWTRIVDAIGDKADSLIRRTIAHAGERSHASDEELVERLARRCFDLIDVDALEKTQARQVQTSETFERRTQSRARYDREQRKEDKSETESYDNDHDGNDDARIRAFYDDPDDYERRWIAFATLMVDIFHVDADVMRVLRNRCGPATRMRVQFV